MSSGRKPHGFTIVETMVVLAVSAAILVSALTLVTGSQNRTEFNQAINDIDQQVNDVMNNVANGYYANNNNFANTNDCVSDAATGAPKFVTGTNGQGGNNECIFIGRIIQFTNSSDFYIHNVVGLRVAGDPPKNTTKMTEAMPRIIESTTLHNDSPDSTDVKKLKNGLKVGKMTFTNGPNTVDTQAVGFFGHLAENDTSSGDLKSGGIDVDFAPVQPTLSAEPISHTLLHDQFVDEFMNFNNPLPPNHTQSAQNLENQLNPDKGVVICFENGGNKHAELTIGGANRRVTTKMEIKDGGSC